MSELLLTLLLQLWLALSTSCLATPTCLPPERAALLSFKAAITKDPSNTLASWRSSNPNCCSHWQGVTCDSSGHVVQLRLSNSNLAGIISPSLSGLSFLQSLSLDLNSLTGSIPGSFARLSRLQNLDVSYNKLSGPLPPSIGAMASLQHIRIYNNLISGSIPASFGQLSSLVNADLALNRLSGQVPDAITANLTSLFFLYLDHNQITGLPKHLSNLKSLQIVFLNSNPIKSIRSIAGLATLPKLGELHLSACGLSGPFPQWVAHLPQLQDSSDEVTPLIDLSQNAITGPIPAALGSVANLESLSLNHNQLAGPIPAALANITTLRFLSLQENRLSGRIPAALAALKSLSIFNVSHNMLSGPIPQLSPFTTFPASSFQYNPRLCGTPLPTPCKH